MSTPIEQRLKSQMDAVQVRLRADLAREAHRAFRRHRIVRRSAAVAGTAIVAALAVTFSTGTVPFSAGGQQPGPLNSQYPIPSEGVVPPASFAAPPAPDSLTPQQAARDIFIRRETTGEAGLPARGIAFYYGDDNRQVAYGTDQAPQDDQSTLVTSRDGKSTFISTYVRYPDRTWLRIEEPPIAHAVPGGPGQSLCGSAQDGGLDNEDPLLLMKGAASLVTCPQLTVTRGLSISGVDAITVATPRSGKTMWLNAHTYLPIQVVTVHANHLPADVVQYGYLAPAPDTMRYLAATIPAGFTRSAFPPTVLPGPAVPVAPWTPPAGVIPPFRLKPVPAPDGLTAAQAKRDIEWVRTTTTAIPAADTVIETVFQYKSASRDLAYYPDGRPWDDSQLSAVQGKDGKVTSYLTVVSYDKRTVSRTVTGTGLVSRTTVDACGTAQQAGLANIDYQLAPDAARSLLKCTGMTITRGQTIGGTGAITIAHGSQTLWVNATTYLPIEIVIVNTKGDYPPAGFNNAPSPGETIEFSWLPPTPANLAYVGIPIPAGFRHTQ